MSGIGSYIVRVLGGAEKDILAAAKTVTGYIDNIIVTDIEPSVEVFFTQIVPAEVAALKPFALEAIQELEVDLPTLLTGGIGAFWAAVAPALLLTATKAEAAGISAAQPVVLAAVGSVIAEVTPANTAA